MAMNRFPPGTRSRESVGQNELGGGGRRVQNAEGENYTALKLKRLMLRVASALERAVFMKFRGPKAHPDKHSKASACAR